MNSDEKFQNLRSSAFICGSVSSPCSPCVRVYTLDFEHEACWIFERLFYAHEKADRFTAIDKAVVVAEGEVHHGADLDLVVDDDRPFLDRVHPEDAALRRVEDRRARWRYGTSGHWCCGSLCTQVLD